MYINKNPRIKPTLAGIQLIKHNSSALSIEGIINDQTEAAIITPAANPIVTFCVLFEIPSFVKKTKEEPSVVIKKINISPNIE